MNHNIFGKFSENFKKVLIAAEKIAHEQNTLMDTEHQLLALTIVKDNLANDILSSYDLSESRIQVIAALAAPKNILKKQEGLTSDAKKAIQDAVKIASKHNHSIVDCEHLLLSLVSNRKFNSYSIIERVGVKPNDVKDQIEVIFKNSIETRRISDQNIEFDNEIMDDFSENPSYGPIGPIPGMQTQGRVKKESALEMFTTNVTKLAQTGKLDPVIGRDLETERLIQTLSRRTKNNPILIGEPGVGKTSIVEGLAQRINSGHVPPKILGKEILSVDMGAIIAGTMYRGQFESRIKKILAEIKKKGNIILFIDEIHTVVGAGSTEGSIDAANLFKPMLAKGELRLIGSTTFDEYKKHIEKDTAFERRFQPIKISEPTVNETIKILNGIKQRYESYHDVKYTDEAIEAAAKLSKRYINDRFLPDKAIDLIDEAAAATNVVSKDAIKLAQLKRDLREILQLKEDFIMKEQYEEATRLREKEIKILDKINNSKEKNKFQIKPIIDTNDIAQLVSRWTGVPISSLSIMEKKQLKGVENRIKKRIVGQDEAVLEVSQAIKRARIGISHPNRPTGSFIFLGPTGVGKSELAKVLAKEILGDENALIKIDMSEFMERHNVSRLVGAPAGYIGYEEGGKLTEIVRKNPYAVILLDEMEKAHPEVFNILLQVLEDGTLTDAKGRKVDFKNTIIIMTSNLGTDFINKQISIGFNKSGNHDIQYSRMKEKVLESVEKFFKPEFVNRIDKIIVFKPLDKNAIKKIVDIQLSEFKKRLEDNHFKFEISKPARDWIAEKGYDPNFGARPIRKVITEYIETPLSEAILNEEFARNDTIHADLKGEKIVLTKKQTS